MAPLPGASTAALVDGFSKNKVARLLLAMAMVQYEKRTKSCVFCSSLVCCTGMRSHIHTQDQKYYIFRDILCINRERKHESQQSHKYPGYVLLCWVPLLLVEAFTTSMKSYSPPISQIEIERLLSLSILLVPVRNSERMDADREHKLVRE